MTMPASGGVQGRAEVLAWQRTVDAAWQQTQQRLGIPNAGRNGLMANLPAPPSDADLLRDYHVDDDQMIKVGDRVVTLSEAAASLGSDKTWNPADKLGLNPANALAHMEIEDKASNAAKESFGGTGPDGKQNGGTGDNHRDAFRHAYWNALMSTQFGEHWAEQVGTGHERRPDDPEVDPQKEARAEAMDLYNNKIGREIANSLGPDASDEDVRVAVEQAVRDGKLVMFNEDRTALVPSRDLSR